MKNQLQNLTNKLSELKIKLATQKGIAKRIQDQVKELELKISFGDKDLKERKEAHILLLGFISKRRDSAIQSIQDIGTHALRAVYGDDYKLHFLKNEERKNTAAFKMEIGIESTFNKEKIITGLKDERGGGVVETASFALRIAALQWLGYKGPLILDEAYKSMSSDEKIIKVAEFLKTYVQHSGRQVIFATHKADIFEQYADHIVYINKYNGISKASSQNHE